MGVKIIAKRTSMPRVGWYCKTPASCPTAPAKIRSRKSSSQLARRSSWWWPLAVRSGGGLRWMGWARAGCARPDGNLRGEVPVSRRSGRTKAGMGRFLSPIDGEDVGGLRNRGRNGMVRADQVTGVDRALDLAQPVVRCGRPEAGRIAAGLGEVEI